MKFKQKFERSLSVRFSIDRKKKMCNSGDIWNGMLSGNLKTNDYCYKNEIDSKLSSGNLNSCNKAETCQSLLHEGNIIHGLKCNLTTDTKNISVQGCTSRIQDNDTENNVPLKFLPNFPLESESVNTESLYHNPSRAGKRQKKESIFKRKFYKTRKKAEFVKRISNTKNIAKISDRNLSANLKSHILADMTEIIDISKCAVRQMSCNGKAIISNEDKRQSAGMLKHDKQVMEDFNKRSNLQLNLENRNSDKLNFHVPKTETEELNSGRLSVKMSKDLSPTCADIYGIDEIDNVSFDKITTERDCIHALKAGNVSEDIESQCFFKRNAVDILYSDTQSASETGEEFHETSEMNSGKNILNKATNEVCETNSKNNKYMKRLSVKNEDLSRISSLRRISGPPHSTNTKGHEVYENPWVLQDSSVKSQHTSLGFTNIEIESSLGFEVNTVNPEEIETGGTALVRSSSLESVDSFGSSYHSVNSVKDLYFSDSEAEHNLEDLTSDSVEGASEMSVSKAELDSREVLTKLDQASKIVTSVEQTSKKLSKVNKRNKRPSNMDHFPTGLDHIDTERKTTSDSDSDQKQMIPYALAESCSNVTVRRKKKKLHSRSFDEKLDRSVLESPERDCAGKKTSLIKSVSLGFSGENEAKTGEKVKHFRRSLDSSLAQRSILSELQSPEKRKSVITGSNEFLSPVLESDVKVSKNVKEEHGEVEKNLDPTRFFTLPNPKKLKSQQQNLKKRLSRLGSVSKLISDKASSLSNLKMGASFKLRKEIEKSKELVSSSATSFSDLMSKKASSFSTLIRRRTNSNTAVESPFKKYSKKVNKVKEENPSELVYEKVRIRVPTKRPVTSLERTARSKRLRVNLRLAQNACKSESEKCDFDSKSRTNSYVGRPWSSESVSPVKSPTLLDEIMKSVDTAGVRQQCSVSNDDLEPSDCGESSSGSSLFLFQKQYSLDSDTNLVKDTTLMTVCRVCGKIRSGSDRSSDSSDSLIVKRHSGSYRFSLSLCDLSSTCLCLKQDRACRNRFSVILPVTKSLAKESDLSANRRSWDIISDFKGSVSDEIKGGNVSRKVKKWLPSCQRPSSMFDLRHNLNETKEEKIEFEIGEAVSRESIDNPEALPGTLLRHKPLLDLSGEHLDETEDSLDVIDDKEDSYARKSQSCGDLLESGRYYENEITKNDLVKEKMKHENDEETESFHSCSETVEEAEADFVLEGNVDKQKSHSCSNLLDANEENLQDNLKVEEQRKKELRKVKVKSMSSSHDALSTLVTMETVNIDEVNGFLATGLGDNGNFENDKDVESGQSIVNNIIELTQNGLDIENEVSKRHSDTVIHTELENRTTIERSDMHEDDKENATCKKCNCLRNVSNEIKQRTNSGLNPLGYAARGKIVSKPPLPRHRRQAKVLSLSDISNHDNVDYQNLRRQKGFSMIELHEESRDVCMCKPEFGSDDRNFKSLPKTLLGRSESSVTPKSGSLRKTVRKFLFDDKQVQNYIKTVSKLDRQKSISSDNINSSSVDSPKQADSNKLHSACSLNRLSRDSWSDEVFNRLSFPLRPQLSPYVEFFESTPLKGFSRLSGPRITSPGLLPELPALTEECVYKYDVCLGYLLHSVQCDNKMICVYSLQRNKQLMESVITPLTASPHTPHRKTQEHGSVNKNKAQHKTKLEEFPNPAAPITNVPSDRLAHAGLVLRTVLLARAPHMIRDRKFHLRTYRRCMVGTEMVDWLLQQSALVHSRTQAVGMWQALVEEGVVVHVCHEHQFKDKYLFYRFHEDDEGVSTVPSSATKRECEDDLPDVFLMLAHIGPDAMMRMILRKPPHERTSEDLEIIYEELLHIKALSHLSTMVKRELASVLLFESHAKSGTVLFNQGDEGKSWYIILKGSVNVVIYGKGVVCTLHEGDDFGKLALVNDAPRAATIVLRDDNCHFLRVDKEDFNRILRDVEANTVRLKEHGQDVLVLEKIPSNTQTADGSVQAHYKYSVMAGTPEKMLEHLLDSRLDNKNETEIDGFLEDFLLTHVIFMPCNHLCPVLLSHYHSSTADTTEQEGFEFMLNHKKCVLHFVQEWANIVGVAFKEDHTINAFLEELHSCVQDDLEDYPTLKDDLVTMETIINTHSGSPSSKMKKRMSGSFTFTRKHSKDCYQDVPRKRKPTCPSDETIFKVYCADHTYSTLKLPMDTKVEQLLLSTKEKLGLGDDLILCEVKSTGERLIFKENDLCVTTGLSINGQLFVTPKEHLDALTPLPEQEGPSEGSFSTIEMFSSREMAYHMTQYDWELFTCVQEYELIYQVFGRYKFGKITANLDLFLRRFNEIQFWIVTEMVLTNNLSKRVSLLRKFIKLAAHCKEFRNLNSFFAIVMGLSNIAVSRLSQTWEKLPSKFKKMFADFETLMDPSRNHRVYRLSVAKMLPPIIPFMPLLMKDMTFTHEGNKTYFDGLVNFEKMHMIAQTLKTVRFCRSARLEIEAPGTLKSSDTSEYIRSLKVIDNQRLLTQLSHKLEPRKT